MLMSLGEMNSCSEKIKLPDMPELTFDDPTHTYRLNGIVIPSVTTVMEPLSAEKYKGISESTLDNAANKGTEVHNAIENWIKFGIEDISSEFKGYLDGFLEWWKLRKPIVIGSEIRAYHKVLMYGGTLDLLCIIDGKLTLVDFKSTSVLSDMLCGVQLEGYSQALASHGIKVENKRILHLKKDGKWSDPEYPASDPLRWRVFGSLKCVYDYIQSSPK